MISHNTQYTQNRVKRIEILESIRKQLEKNREREEKDEKILDSIDPKLNELSFMLCCVSRAPRFCVYSSMRDIALLSLSYKKIIILNSYAAHFFYVAYFV